MPQIPASMKDSINTPNNLLQRMNTMLKEHPRRVMGIGVVITILLSLFMFNTTVSTGGDDSGYIIAAKKFAEGVHFPSWHGAFYPIFLSWFYKLFGGIHVVAFKFISLALVVAHFIFFFETFRDKTPKVAFVWSVATIAISGHLIYYASQTYSEALYLMLQAAVFFYFYRFEKEMSIKPFTRIALIHWGVLALLMFLLSTTRNVGIGVILAVVAYLIIRKRYRAIIPSMGFFILFHTLFKLYKSIVWNVQASGIAGQLENMTWKHFYRHQLGKEDFMGYIIRVWDNANLYFSRHFAMMIGLRPGDSKTIAPVLTIVIIALFIGATIIIWRHKKRLLLVACYLVILIGGTFVTQQKHWDQERLILVYVPLMIIYLGTAIHFGVKQLGNKQLQRALWVGAALLVFSTAWQTSKRLDFKHISQLSKGNKYAGFTPDWHNYLEMCEWSARHLPDDAKILCRKPNMATIYGDAHFIGRYRIPHLNADSIRNKMRREGITHVIMANLRRDPKKRTSKTINTIQRSLSYYTSRYPAEIRIIKKIGKTEPAYLMEIKWDTPTTIGNMRKTIDAAIIINPKNFKLTRLKAKFLMDQKNYSSALSFIEHTITITKSQNIADLYNQSHCLMKLKRYKKSTAVLEQIIKRQDSGLAHLKMCECLCLMDKKDEAQEHLNIAKKMGVKKIPKEIQQMLKS